MMENEIDIPFIRTLLKSNGKSDVSTILIKDNYAFEKSWIWGAVYAKLLILFFLKFCIKRNLEVSEDIKISKNFLFEDNGICTNLDIMKQQKNKVRESLQWNIVENFTTLFQEIHFGYLQKCDSYWTIQYFDLPWDEYINSSQQTKMDYCLCALQQEDIFLSFAYEYMESDYEDFSSFIDNILVDNWDHLDNDIKNTSVFENHEDFVECLDEVRNMLLDLYDSAMSMLPDESGFEKELFAIQYSMFLNLAGANDVSYSFILTNPALDEYLVWRVSHQREIRDMFLEEDDSLMDMVAMLLNINSGYGNEFYSVKYHNNHLVVLGESIYCVDSFLEFPHECLPLVTPYLYYEIDLLLDEAKRVFGFEYEKNKF